LIFFVATPRLNLALPDFVGLPSKVRGPRQLRSLVRQQC